MKTLADYPELLLQLHPDNNPDLAPETLSYGSNKKLYWRCDEADDHVWHASVKEHAATGRGQADLIFDKCLSLRPRIIWLVKIRTKLNASAFSTLKSCIYHKICQTDHLL